jgi:GNAT superfamily N-acetyltransferase
MRKATDTDRAALQTDGPGFFADGPEVGALAFHRREGGDLVGLTYCAWGQEQNLVHILSVMIAPELRGWGFGSEAVELAEGQYPSSSFVARVDPKDGLNLYFWLRLGYRPAGRESPVCTPSADGMITMIRRYDQT